MQALFPQISSNGLAASVHLSTTKSASVKLLLTSTGHAQLDLKT